MAVANPWKITYGSRSVGGDSDSFLLSGPYAFDKTFESIRMVFDVVVVASSFDELKTLSDAIESDFRERDKTLVIDIDGSSWTYTFGETILNTRASVTKSANRDVDRGFSRGYTCTIEGEIPAGAVSNNGLRDYEIHVKFESSRQKVISMRGTYTAVGTPTQTTASEQYQDPVAGFDSEAATVLTAIDSSATFELVDEEYERDRNDHLCMFSRQYVQVLANQTQQDIDSAKVRDHRITFTDTSQHPGEGDAEIHRLRRVLGSYDCAVDVDQGVNARQVFRDDILPHVKALFTQNFNPQIYCVEELRVSYDDTSSRMSIAVTFLYQTQESGGIVEISQSLAFREARTIDYTPRHSDDELAADADAGWAVVERVGTRTVSVVGTASPRRRLGVDAGGWPGKVRGIEGGKNVTPTGWNIVSNTSQAEEVWIGDPAQGDQIRLTILSETVVERLNEK